MMQAVEGLGGQPIGERLLGAHITVGAPEAQRAKGTILKPPSKSNWVALPSFR